MTSGPLLLAGGGSGIVPLMAMLRARIAAGSDVPVRLLVSARSIDEIIYRAELESIASANSGVEIIRTLTRTQPSGWTGYARRVDQAMLAEIAWPADETASIVRLRTDRLRRNGRLGPRRARARAGEHPDRAIRSDWRMRWRTTRTSTATRWAAC